MGFNLSKFSMQSIASRDTFLNSGWKNNKQQDLSLFHQRLLEPNIPLSTDDKNVGKDVNFEWEYFEKNENFHF
jgi:hypothetical protein